MCGRIQEQYIIRRNLMKRSVGLFFIALFFLVGCTPSVVVNSVDINDNSQEGSISEESAQQQPVEDSVQDVVVTVNACDMGLLLFEKNESGGYNICIDDDSKKICYWATCDLDKNGEHYYYYAFPPNSSNCYRGGRSSYYGIWLLTFNYNQVDKSNNYFYNGKIKYNGWFLDGLYTNAPYCYDVLITGNKGREVFSCCVYKTNYSWSNTENLFEPVSTEEISSFKISVDGYNKLLQFING